MRDLPSLLGGSQTTVRRTWGGRLPHFSDGATTAAGPTCGMVLNLSTVSTQVVCPSSFAFKGRLPGQTNTGPEILPHCGHGGSSLGSSSVEDRPCPHLPTASLTSDPTFPCVPSEEQYEEQFLQEETVSQQINSIELLQTRPLAPPEVVKPQRPLQRQVHLRGRPASQPTVIRGITYYKAKVSEEENDIEEQQDEFFSGENGVDLLIEDQLLRHNDLLASATRRPAATHQGHSTAAATDLNTRTTAWSSALPPPSTSAPSIADPASVGPLSAALQTTLVSPDPTRESVQQPSPQVPATTVAHTATQQPTAPAPPAVPPREELMEATHTAPVPPITVRTHSRGKNAPAGQQTTPASPTLSPEEEDDIRNVIGSLSGRDTGVDSYWVKVSEKWQSESREIAHKNGPQGKIS
ncbi:Olfactomedin-like protein 2B [Saguinus oedipus]|uniref:Olfactomedin-like protein 2B n=1 Tax=Saguinus oedipus TaxID=9490 RepID=A0ABQ9TIL1_SAGOE|nr:Olfactomedin-like protein 2B [Saguinus oedipus]